MDLLSMKTYASSANMIVNIVFDALDRPLIHKIKRNGPRIVVL